MVNWRQNGLYGIFNAYSILAWMNWDIEKRKAKWDEEPCTVELYDHSSPPKVANDFKIKNVADNNKQMVRQFQKWLKALFGKPNTNTQFIILDCQLYSHSSCMLCIIKKMWLT